MTDIERLNEWMKANNFTVWQLAREMDCSRHTVNSVVNVRKAITAQFVTRFIRRFGADEAGKIFTSHLAPIAAIH